MDLTFTLKYLNLEDTLSRRLEAGRCQIISRLVAQAGAA